MSRLWLLAAAALFASGALAPSAGALSSKGIIAKINEQRVFHGLPGKVANSSARADGCKKHNRYQRLNGGQLTHFEQKGKPGYSKEGAAAARASVLSRGILWSQGNPWEAAPIHLAALLAPRLNKAGADETGDYNCVVTNGLGRKAPKTPTVYVYPGEGKSYPGSETASEGPYTPGQRVGIKDGTETGPYLFVFFDGPLSTSAAGDITKAALTGPNGPVELKVADNKVRGLETFLPTGGVLIPRKPLPEGVYTASVAGNAREVFGPDKGKRVDFARTWSFNVVPALPVGVFE